MEEILENDYLYSAYSFMDRVIKKRYDRIIKGFKYDFQDKDIDEIYGQFFALSNKKYLSVGNRALQIALFELLLESPYLVNVNLIQFTQIQTEKGLEYVPYVNNMDIVRRTEILNARQQELMDQIEQSTQQNIMQETIQCNEAKPQATENVDIKKAKTDGSFEYGCTIPFQKDDVAYR